MGFLVLLFGFVAVYYGVVGLPYMYAKGTGYFVYAIFLETIVTALFVLFLKKYFSPKRRERRRLKRIESKKRRALRRKAFSEQMELNRLRTTIAYTCLYDDGNVERKTRVGAMIFRGLLGCILAGSSGAAIGVYTAKDKLIVRFRVVYCDGHTEIKEVEKDSLEYKGYIGYLLSDDE